MYAQLLLARSYLKGKGVEKNGKKLWNGMRKQQNKEMLLARPFRIYVLKWLWCSTE